MLPLGSFLVRVLNRFGCPVFPSLPGFGPETTGASCHWHPLAHRSRGGAISPEEQGLGKANWGNLQELSGENLWGKHGIYTCKHTIRIYEVWAYFCGFHQLIGDIHAGSTAPDAPGEGTSSTMWKFRPEWKGVIGWTQGMQVWRNPDEIMSSLILFL